MNVTPKNLKLILMMNVAWLGMQIGFTLQAANISGIYEYFGAKPDQIPILWLAMSFTGLLIQPIIGIWSDNSCSKLGRRKPYILVGTIIAALSLFIIPYCSSLWYVIMFVWVFNCFMNVALGPLRAFIADNLTDEQMNLGYSVQGIIIAFGTVLAACFPWVLTHIFSIGANHNGILPSFIKISFTIGGIVLFITGLLTILYGEEAPLESKNIFVVKQNFLFEIINAVSRMPKSMRRIALVQFLAWLGLSGVFMYFPIMIADDIFKNQYGTVSYDNGIEWAGICFGFYSVIQLFTSFVIPWLSKKIAEKNILLITLLCGGIGISSVFYLETQSGVLWSMFGLGMMVAGINILPFSILGKILPKEKIGVYMGIFNIFTTAPGVLLSLAFGPVIHYLFFDSRTCGVVVSGASMIIAAILAFGIQLSEPHQS